MEAHKKDIHKTRVFLYALFSICLCISIIFNLLFLSFLPPLLCFQHYLNIKSLFCQIFLCLVNIDITVFEILICIFSFCRVLVETKFICALIHVESCFKCFRFCVVKLQVFDVKIVSTCFLTCHTPPHPFILSTISTPPYYKKFPQKTKRLIYILIYSNI